MPIKAPDDTRVVKRIAPNEPGALKLARRYGNALVCVRYRHDATGQHRYTTVELIVDDAAIVPRGPPEEMVGVRIDPNQSTLLSRAYARGATGPQIQPVADAPPPRQRAQAHQLHRQSIAIDGNRPMARCGYGYPVMDGCGKLG